MGMSPLEIIACLVSVIGVALTVFRNMWSWLFNFFAYILYGYLFFTYQLYGETILQGCFVVLGVYGFLVWLKTKQINHDIIIQPLGTKKAIIQIVMAIVAGVVFGWGLKTFTPAALPLLDAQLAALSLLATYWTSQKHIATWILWVVVDIVYVGMFSYKALYLTAVLYAAFVVMAGYGWYMWDKVQKSGLYKHSP